MEESSFAMVYTLQIRSERALRRFDHRQNAIRFRDGFFERYADVDGLSVVAVPVHDRCRDVLCVDLRKARREVRTACRSRVANLLAFYLKLERDPSAGHNDEGLAQQDVGKAVQRGDEFRAAVIENGEKFGFGFCLGRGHFDTPKGEGKRRDVCRAGLGLFRVVPTPDNFHGVLLAFREERQLEAVNVQLLGVADREVFVGGVGDFDNGV
jgi:hypothetical protein